MLKYLFLILFIISKTTISNPNEFKKTLPAKDESNYKYFYFENYPKEKLIIDLYSLNGCLTSNNSNIEKFNHTVKYQNNESKIKNEVKIWHLYINYNNPIFFKCDKKLKIKKLFKTIQIESEPKQFSHFYVTFLEEFQLDIRH